MAHLEWYRTFTAIYRTGTVSGAARARHLTQPAVSQQLAALESFAGAPLFVRTPRGMQPTQRGQELYAQVFEAVDRLERVTRGMKNAPGGPLTVRLGVPAEYFHSVVLERLAGPELQLNVTLGEERELIGQVESGVLDLAITTLRPASRGVQHRMLGERRYVLVGPAGLSGPDPALPPAEAAGWLNAQPWVSYSAELPTTRRLWQQLGARFAARVALVVPDLRSVLRAVELGVGCSLLPEYLCAGALADGRVRELYPVRELLAGEHWALAFRVAEADRPELVEITRRLSGAGEASGPQRRRSTET